MSRRVALVDFLSGRGLGGHLDDYLAALRAALAGEDLLAITPFADGAEPPRGRLGTYRLELAGYRRALREADVAIVHSAELSDYLCVWIAAMTVSKSRRAKVLFVLRRSPDPHSLNVGSDFVARILIRVITRMIRRAVIRPLSDSRPALEAWLALAPGAQGDLVELPPPPPDRGESTIELPQPSGPLLAVAGRMRAEKGAGEYPRVVELALSALPDCAIALQTSEDDAVARAALAKLEERHAGDARVRLLGEHLSAADYRALLEAADVVVLPYNVTSYGAGTSGVVSDALAAGAAVVVTPIEWARVTYSDEPRVIFVERLGSDEELTGAIKRAAAIGPASDAVVGAEQRFAKSWLAAIDAIS